MTVIPMHTSGRRAHQSAKPALLLKVLVPLLLLLGCQSAISPEGPASPVAPGSSSQLSAEVAMNANAAQDPDALASEKNQPPGLTFKLSEGVPDAASREALPRPTAPRLDDGTTQKVLQRLPPVPDLPSDARVDFKVRDTSLPPPRPGQTLQGTFPPPDAPDAPSATAKGPLTVLRYQPEGAVPLAPLLSVTFSQPMVAVTSLETLNAQVVPVKLTPQPPGQWRWIGTQTLLFEPEGRFPMATEYAAEVAAGTRPATGSTGEPLAQAFRFTFSTPPPQVLQAFPEARRTGTPTSRDPVMFLEFDQRVDPGSVLEALTLSFGGKSLKVRAATATEIEADPTVRALVQQAQAERWVAFRSTEQLPTSTTVAIVLGKGVRSLEGPRPSIEEKRFEFNTYGPLKVKESRCGWDNRCVPFTPWQITFTNPLDAKALTKSMVKVTPELPGMKVAAYGQTLSINGQSKGRTTYQVTLSPEIKDSFGQTLGSEARLTFQVGPSEPALVGQGGNFVMLDPYGPPRYSVYSINHSQLKVRLYAVQPTDWEAFRLAMRERYQNTGTKLPGKLIENTIPVQNVADTLVETSIDLSAALKGGLGQVIVVVESTLKPRPNQRPEEIVAWVQASQLAVDAFWDGEELTAWVTRLKDGTPITNAEVRLEGKPATMGTAVRTDATGLARLPLTQAGSDLLVARDGNDLVMLPSDINYWSYGNPGWSSQPSTDELRWYVFDDRKMYRPGEKVSIKGWLRLFQGKKGGDIIVPPMDGNLNYILRDSMGNELSRGQAPFSQALGFHFTLDLPPTVNLGDTSLELIAPTTVPGANFYHSFQVQEFRRPEFSVSAAAGPGPNLVGSSATTTVSARYYAGGGLSGADTTWQVNASPGSFSPPNHSDYIFGSWQPWWGFSGRYGRIMPDDNGGEYQNLTSRTDSSGDHTLRLDFLSVNPPRPMNVHAEATVMDVNRQAWTASSDLLVHPSSLYVGVKSDKVFVQKGESLEVDLVVTDLDGKRVPGRKVLLTAHRQDWEQEQGETVLKEVDLQRCDVVSAEAPVRCVIKPPNGGAWILKASVRDLQGRLNQTELTRWVAGGDQPPVREVEREEVQLIPDKDAYKPGDVAKILVLSPFSPAEGVLRIERSGILKTERFTLKEPSTVLSIPLVDGHIPNLIVKVDLAGATKRVGADGNPDPRQAPRPAYAAGQIELKIPAHSRTLAVTVTPEEQGLEPGGKTNLAIQVKDATGKGVAGAELAVVAVDESILSLTGYKLEDPIALFYASRMGNGQERYVREHLLLASATDVEVSPEQLQPPQMGFGRGGMAPGAIPPPAPMLMMAAPMAEGAAMPKSRAREKMAKNEMADGDSTGALADASPSEASGPIALRTNFNPLALFAPAVNTDANGNAAVALTLPDNLTRYRIMVVAVHSDKFFGTGESAVTARLPLMVRPSAPRFLNFGDKFELPIVVQNQTNLPLEVLVAVKATNATLPNGGGRRVQVPANDRVEVRFSANADMAGTARFQIAAMSGRFADAAQVELPVYTPATSEAFATYGQVDEGAISQPILPPDNVFSQFGGLEITTSSTALQGLTDAMLYLVQYPFDCAEQISSRILGIVALRDVLTAFQVKEMPSPEALQQKVSADLERLRQLQNNDGGFPFWRRGDESWPFLSVHVAHALARAKEKGYTVPEDMLQRSLNHLRTIERHLKKEYSPESRRAILAYALFVRAKMGDSDPAKARSLVKEVGVEKTPLESLGFVLPIFAAAPGYEADVQAILKVLNNRATETASTAAFTEAISDGAYVLLHSNRRTDGILLDALIAADPKSTLIPKLVTGLLAHRKAGKWLNTQENVFILLAMDRYFATYEKVTPDFLARVWLGGRFAGEHAFRGRTSERHQLNVPMTWLQDPKNAPDKVEGKAGQNLILSKEGAGRLYYRIGMRYAPKDLSLKPLDAGFTVQRAYESVDKPDDVKRDKDGIWHIKAGARVKVRLTMVATSRRYHVALVDPLPAGLEPLNPALATTGSLPNESSEVTTMGAVGFGGMGRGLKYGWWNRPWYEHQNMRDERVEAFTSLLWEGVHTYVYFARATTPGEFVVPPTRAEEMYMPETFGRAATEKVLIED